MPRAGVHAHYCSSLEEIQTGARNVPRSHPMARLWSLADRKMES